ncbi:MAG: YihY/virulence factor BrkB family protein [Clostridia bacterium]|nr:YihY/virulence factor BrkB family protein [Clostridia bacterium]
MLETLYLRLYPALHRSRLFHLAFRLICRFTRDDLTGLGAMLAYDLLFCIFPLLLFVNSLLPLFSEALLHWMSESLLVPDDIVRLFADYLLHIDRAAAPTALMSLLLSLWFLSRMARALSDAIDRAMRVKKERSTLGRILLSLLLSLALVMVLLLSLLLLVAGDYLAGLLQRLMPPLAGLLTHLLHWRVAVIAVLSLMLLTGLYRCVPGRHLTRRQVLPGAVLVVAGWQLLSFCFAWYVEHAGRYSLYYGSLGGVMVLLLWLYLTGILLVTGALLNDLLLTDAAWRVRQQAAMQDDGPRRMIEP